MNTTVKNRGCFRLKRGVSHPDGNLRKGEVGKGGYDPGKNMYVLWFGKHRRADHWHPVYFPKKQVEALV